MNHFHLGKSPTDNVGFSPSHVESRVVDFGNANRESSLGNEVNPSHRPLELSSSHNAECIVYACFAGLKFLTAGKLNPWLGPAIRGMIMKPLREQLCQLPDPERSQRLKSTQTDREKLYCQGCRLNASCLYGRFLEPDRQVIAGRTRMGAREGLRGITVAPNFPICGPAEASGELRIRLLGLGENSQELLRQALLTLNRCGQESGLGPEKVKFEVLAESLQLQQWTLRAADLPCKLEHGKVPWVKIQLETPLLLRQKSPADQARSNRQAPAAGQRSADAKPANGVAMSASRKYLRHVDNQISLPALVQGSIRTVRRALEEYSPSETWLDFDPKPFYEAAAAVPCEHFCWEPITQARYSSRRDQRWQATGWQGYAIYRDVPVCLLPWLVWGGRLGVGDSRNCGGGLWHVVLA